MTAPGGGPEEKPHIEGEQAPAEGTYEAPPIEQAPAQPGYEAPPSPTSYQTPDNFPPPGYPPQSGYPPQPGYPPPGYPPPTGYPEPPAYPGPQQYGGNYPPPPPPQQYGASPYPGGYGYGAPEAGTNTLAIGSLVASVIGVLCGIGSIVGIVLGVVALNQIKRTRQGGYGLAVAGIVVGVATLIISMIWAIYALR